MVPADLQLPEKFTDWRPGQLETVAKAAGSPAYLYMLDAPTGTGKSLTGAALQRLLRKNAVYLCTTKQLQKQLLDDFPYARVLKGRGNYRCLKAPKMFPNITAEHCTHSKSTPCPSRDRCEYVVAKRAALSAPLAILNTAYFLSEVNYSTEGFSGSDLLIIDEADTVEDQLMGFIELKITQRQLDRLSLPAPQFKTKFESWIEWAKPAYDAVYREMVELEDIIESQSSWGTIPVNELHRRIDLKRMASKLKFFIDNVDKDWIWYPGTDSWVFKPVFVSKYSNNALWKHAGKILAMSASFLNPVQIDKNIGLTASKRTYEYEALPCSFPVENRPVYYTPVADVSFKNMDTALPALVDEIGKIIDRYPDQKVLVHCVSYRIKDYFMANLPKKRLITHSTTDREQKLTEFKESEAPLVMISPSMDRGVDLPGEQCRCIIIAKCPFPSLGDPQVKKRVYSTRDDWYALKTLSMIVQMCGRGVRSNTDKCDCYILDSQFKRLSENSRMLPKWFTDALIT